MCVSHKPKISVIVPVYNVEKYLNRCIDSILIQSFVDFELLLVDDGSFDNSGEICDKYAIVDNRVKVIHKQNGGLSDARNFGIDMASGEYIAFVDSDDWIDADYLKILYENALNFDVDISAVNFHREYDDKRDAPPKVITGLYTGSEALSFLYNETMSIYINIACAKLYKIELFESLRYPIGRLHEDGFTTYKLCYMSKKVYFSNNDVYHYYQRNNSIMNAPFSIKRADEYFVYKERDAFFLKHGLPILRRLNAQTRLACIFNLTIKMYDNGTARDDREKLVRSFMSDIKENRGILTERTTKARILTKLYSFSPRLFYYLYKSKQLVRSIRRSVYAVSVIGKLVLKTKSARLLHKNKYAFIVMTPTGGNLGDHALVIAEKKLFSELHLIELPCVDLSIYIRWLPLLKKIVADRCILFNAGGNMGTLWYDVTEVYLRRFIEEFPENEIIILPNTCFYEDSDWGKAEFEKAIQIYNEHKKLTVYVREYVSYELIAGKYNRVFLMPDMVMYLNEYEQGIKREGCLLCIRNDCEKSLRDYEVSGIRCILERLFLSVRITDTVISQSVSSRARECKVNEKLQEFKHAELVVTDRLHGMIFAAITGTPCVVLPSKSHKLLGCYRWVKNFEYIRYLDSLTNLADACQELLGKEGMYSNDHLKHYYESLREDVYSATEKGRLFQ